MKRINRLTMFLYGVFTASHVSAQAADDLPSITVVANPLIERNIIDAFSSSSTMITDEQITQQNSIDLTAALRATPGVQISRFNPVGAFGGAEGGGVYIRSLGASRPGSEIKTYIDDVPFYMSMWNHPLLDLLPLNGMSSIEVHKSPQLQSSGNNFASINLLTKRAVTRRSQAGNSKLETQAKLSTGAFSTVIQQLDAVGESGQSNYMFAQGFSQSQGHRDNADGELKNVMGRFGYQLMPNWNVDTFYLHTDNIAHDPLDERTLAKSDSNLQNTTAYTTQASLISVSVQHQYEMIQGGIKFYLNNGNGNLLDQTDGAGDTLSHFETKGIRWKESITPWRNALLVGGMDYDSTRGDIKFNRDDPIERRDFNAPNFQLTSSYAALSQSYYVNNWEFIPSMSVRHYQHNFFDSLTQKQFGFSTSNSDFKVFVNIAEGANYPGLEVTSLSYLIPALNDSWKSLEAETIYHRELGIQWRVTDSTQLEINRFNDDIKNRYIFSFPPHTFSPQFTNISGYTTQGNEISLHQAFNQYWNLFAGITLLDSNLKTLPYAPKKSITIGSNATVKNVTMSMDAQYQSDTYVMTNSDQSRTPEGSPLESVSGFTVINSRFAYPLKWLGAKGETFIAIENLLDKKYAYRPGYAMPGRWAQIGFRANF